jgi:hypothetical protein
MPQRETLCSTTDDGKWLWRFIFVAAGVAAGILLVTAVMWKANRQGVEAS